MTREITFTKEKETKNTVKFNETAVPGTPPIVGVLYVQKWFAGNATSCKLALTIDPNITAKELL